jgi:molybdopterin converting factor subunit 1
MRVTLLLFSVAKDLAGFDTKELELPDGATTDDVLEMLSKLNSGFRAWNGKLRFAVNQEYVPAHYELQPGDEVAMIPPVSGG